MLKNKKRADAWFWMVSAIIAIGIFVVTWIIVGKSLASSKSNLDNFQSCEGQKGHCRKSCLQGEIENYRSLGCGSGKFEKEEYCCIPPQK